MLESNVERRPSWRARIIAIVLIAALAIALGVAIVVSLPRESEKSALKHLNNQREIVDTSMNLYSPLLDKYSTRYANAFVELAPDDAKKQVFDEEVGRLERDSKLNRERLQHMASSAALDDREVAKAFKEFESAYGKIVDYNDQLVVNVTNVTRSVSGACGTLNKSNLTGENSAEEYVATADSCLTAVSKAKKGSDPETKTLLAVVEKVVGKQRAAMQKLVEADDNVNEFIATGELLLAFLDVNAPLAEATEKWESSTRANYNALVEEANASNEALERALEDSIGSSKTESKGE